MRKPHDLTKPLLDKLFMKSLHTHSGSKSDLRTNKACLNTIPNKHSLAPECLTQTQPDNTAVLLIAGSVLFRLQIVQNRLGIVNIYPQIVWIALW